MEMGLEWEREWDGEGWERGGVGNLGEVGMGIGRSLYFASEWLVFERRCRVEDDLGDPEDGKLGIYSYS
jgi:hypothetical protein